jgi:hypothetical protein
MEKLALNSKQTESDQKVKKNRRIKTKKAEIKRRTTKKSAKSNRIIK